MGFAIPTPLQFFTVMSSISDATQKREKFICARIYNSFYPKGVDDYFFFFPGVDSANQGWAAGVSFRVALPTSAKYLLKNK